MTHKQKPDARRIKGFLTELKESSWLGHSRHWWPDFVFHFTDIQNAVSILREGALFSRHEATERGLMLTDNASQDVLAQTGDQWKDYVRLYFRPRTPTQYRNEGFRPIDRRELNAHCPAPIYFLFDSLSVLSRPDSLFTPGNLAARPDVFSQSTDLPQMPFKLIYHDSPIHDETQKRQVVFHRHAEVIVPKQLDLSSLRFIACRSQAEYETLLHLLPRSTRNRWSTETGLGTKLHLFYKKWTYVETVDLEKSRITIQFNRSSYTPGPFHANVSITDTLSSKRFVWEDDSYMANDSLVLSLEKIGPLWDYSMSLSLDSQLAYAGRYQVEDELPW